MATYNSWVSEYKITINYRVKQGGSVMCVRISSSDTLILIFGINVYQEQIENPTNSSIFQKKCM